MPDEPLRAHELKTINDFLEGITFEISIGEFPAMSTIFIDDQKDHLLWGTISCRLYTEKELHSLARHVKVWIRAWLADIFLRNRRSCKKD